MVYAAPRGAVRWAACEECCFGAKDLCYEMQVCVTTATLVESPIFWIGLKQSVSPQVTSSCRRILQGLLMDRCNHALCGDLSVKAQSWCRLVEQKIQLICAYCLYFLIEMHLRVMRMGSFHFSWIHGRCGVWLLYGKTQIAKGASLPQGLLMYPGAQLAPTTEFGACSQPELTRISFDCLIFVRASGRWYCMICTCSRVIAVHT